MKRIVLFIICSLLLVSFGLGISSLYYWLQDAQSYNSVLASCHSDVLYPFSSALGAYAAAHGGRFPDTNDIPSMLQRVPGISTGISAKPGRAAHNIVCNKNIGLLTRIRTFERPICWCLPHDGEKYAALITLEPDGTTHAKIVTVHQLLGILSKEFGDPILVPTQE